MWGMFGYFSMGPINPIDGQPIDWRRSAQPIEKYIQISKKNIQKIAQTDSALRPEQKGESLDFLFFQNYNFTGLRDPGRGSTQKKYFEVTHWVRGRSMPKLVGIHFASNRKKQTDRPLLYTYIGGELHFCTFVRSTLRAMFVSFFFICRSLVSISLECKQEITVSCFQMSAYVSNSWRGTQSRAKKKLPLKASFSNKKQQGKAKKKLVHRVYFLPQICAQNSINSTLGPTCWCRCLVSASSG